jgi:hypothetical protein
MPPLHSRFVSVTAKVLGRISHQDQVPVWSRIKQGSNTSVFDKSQIFSLSPQNKNVNRTFVGMVCPTEDYLGVDLLEFELYVVWWNPFGKIAQNNTGEDVTS